MQKKCTGYTIKNKSTNENVTSISVSVFHMLIACGTNELLYDKKVDGEELSVCSLGKTGSL